MRRALLPVVVLVLSACADITDPGTLDAPAALAPSHPVGLERADERNGDHGHGRPFQPIGNPFPNGQVGFEVTVGVNGFVQFFTAEHLSTVGGTATQFTSGRVRLAVPPCDPAVVGCGRSAILRAPIERAFAAGSTVNFAIATIVGLPEATSNAACYLESLTTLSFIDGTFLGVPADAGLGDNVVTLPANEPDGIVIGCEVTSSTGF